MLAVAACHGTHRPGGAGSGGDGAETDSTSHGMHGHHGSADDTSGSADESTGGGPVSDAKFDFPSLGTVNDGHFATSRVCAQCHANDDSALAMRDEVGTPIGPDDLWRGTMMANSARDPFWWAMVKAETVATPSRAAEIEAECTHCHAPMAAIREDLYGGPLALDDLLDGSSDRAHLALDGVACAACHQIPATDVLGPPPLPATGEMFGPHANPFTMPMQMHTGFTPAAAGHVTESAICGTCHTLRTDALAEDGTLTGAHLSEQAPYLEWRNSQYTTETAGGADPRSCQDCHMPTRSEGGVELSTRIARRPPGGDFPPISDRSPYGRHVLVGGNTWVPAMLRDFADELRPKASTEDFDATIDAARHMLADMTADVSIVDTSRAADTLSFRVRVDSRVGHKFPSGVPARRAWLRLRVTDASGTVVFASGGVDDEGRLVDGRGSPLPIESVGGPVEPHHTVIDDDAQVQIFESVLGDADGDATYRLLRGEAFLKDNRLLPLGWRTDGPHADETAPRLAGTDADFVGGGDTVTYEVLAPAAAGPYDIEATLWYQPIGSRFAAELFALDAPEIRAFERIWDATDRTPELVGTATATSL